MARGLVPTLTSVGVSSSDIDSVGPKVFRYMLMCTVLHCIAAPKAGTFCTPYLSITVASFRSLRH